MGRRRSEGRFGELKLMVIRELREVVSVADTR